MSDDKRIKAYADAMTKHAETSQRSTCSHINEGLFGKKKGPRMNSRGESWHMAKEYAQNRDIELGKGYASYVTKTAHGKMSHGAVAMAAGALFKEPAFVAGGAALAGIGAAQKVGQLVKGYRKARAERMPVREGFDFDNEFEKALFEALEMGVTDDEILDHIETLDESFGKTLRKAWNNSGQTQFDRDYQRETQRRVGTTVSALGALGGAAVGGVLGAKVGGAAHIPTGALAGGFAGAGLGMAAGVIGTRLAQAPGNLARRVAGTVKRYNQYKDGSRLPKKLGEELDDLDKLIFEMLEADFSETEIINVLTAESAIET